MKLFDVQFGIRLGLQTELWFAYGILGVIPMFGFGFALNWICIKAQSKSNVLAKSIYLTVLGTWATAMLSQSSVVFGVILSLIYLYVLCYVADLAFGIKKDAGI